MGKLTTTVFRVVVTAPGTKNSFDDYFKPRRQNMKYEAEVSDTKTLDTKVKHNPQVKWMNEMRALIHNLMVECKFERVDKHFFTSRPSNPRQFTRHYTLTFIGLGKQDPHFVIDYNPTWGSKFFIELRFDGSKVYLTGVAQNHMQPNTMFKLEKTLELADPKSLLRMKMFLISFWPDDLPEGDKWKPQEVLGL